MKKTIVAVTLLGSCASAFPYKYYGIDLANQKLTGASEKEDLPLSICSPDETVKGKCAVFLVDELERLQTDFVSVRQRLEQCEKRER